MAMGFWLEGVIKLLLTEAGSLVYHLVLAFSIAGALTLVLNQSVLGVSARQRRSLIGLGILLLLQLALFAVSALSSQGIINGEALLPPLDRIVMLLSLVVVIWLWSFPDPAPLADAAIFLLGILLATAGIFTVLWWSNQSAGGGFNNTWPDVAAQIIGISLCVIGIVSLFSRRVEGREYSLWMLVILIAGFGVQLTVVTGNNDYPAVVRLAQMAAFPFLLLLAQRTGGGELTGNLSALADAIERVGAPVAAQSRYADSQLWQALTRLAAEPDPERVCSGITATLAQSLRADLCLLLLPPDAAGKMAVKCAYDLKEKRTLDPLTFDSRALPMLASSLRMGRPRRFASGSTSPDLASLARAYNLERMGNLLFTPVLAPDGKPIISIVLFSPYSNRDWDADEQAFLGALARLLVHFLQRSQQMNSLKEEMNQMRQLARLAQEQSQQAVEERQKLRDRVAVLEDHAQQDQMQLASLGSAAAAYELAQKNVTQLQAENEQLADALRLATESSAQQQQSVEGELRLALEEIAFLRLAVADADQKITALKTARTDVAPSGTQLDSLIAIAQDIRQPLSSIVGYTDFLLSEKAGILVAQQRKQLERIKIATERMNRLVDDLLQAMLPENNPTHLEFRDLDVREVIHTAVTELNQLRRERGVALQLDLPEKPLRINSDRYALKSVFSQLLQNASLVSPPGSDVTLKACVESSEGQADYVLVQVSDSGPGYKPQDLVRIFTPQPADLLSAKGRQNGVDFSRLKTLVEAIGGRTWVDSEAGHGATYSVLLPVSQDPAKGNGKGAAQ